MLTDLVETEDGCARHLQRIEVMPNQIQPEKQRPAQPVKKLEDKQGEELLREQSKTETEKNPYLDTEGGE